MKYFCSVCGKPTIYALATPKFCSQCGSDFSLVTKQKDKSVHDQALEKAKEKYSDNNPEFIPVTKARPKNYPNPARASFKLVADNEYAGDGDMTEDDERYDKEAEYVDVSQFSKIKPKFTLQSVKGAAESFENLMAQGYATNYKSASPEEMRQFSENTPASSPDSILEDFKREAGSIRGEQN
jgi:hypothetical protein